MAFTSLAFILLAAVTLLVYYLVPKRVQWWVLLAASYVFYFFSGSFYWIFLLLTTAVTYLTARVMQGQIAGEDAAVAAHRDTWDKATRKAYRAREKKKRFWILLSGLFVSLGVLAVLKYTGFVLTGISSVVALFGGEKWTVPSLLLPLGISFYTFQSVGYLIDVYRKKVEAEKNPFRLALFVSFFPQLIQGPISRFSDLSAQLTAPHSFSGEAFFSGFLRVLWGFFKKLVIADTVMVAVRTLVTPVGGGYLEGGYVFLLILLYSVQIYGDFTGGIDITIGLSEMMGIRLTENFDRPFSSRSTKEYWRRWHITMGSWFTDYVFYPLSVTGGMQRLSKWSRAHHGEAIGKRIPVYTATVVTWFLTGLWHGAGANFIVWGLLNCLVILVSQELNPLYLRFHAKFPSLQTNRFYILFQCTRTFLLMGLIRSLDCYRNVGVTFRLWGSMLYRWNWGSILGGGLGQLGLSTGQWLLLALSVLTVLLVTQAEKRAPIRPRLLKRPLLCTLCICLLLTIILVFGSYGIGFDSADFIYGQF